MRKIREMLASHDLEMAQLGVALLEETIPPDAWRLVLKDCLNKKFSYNIVNGEIFIYISMEGIYSQLHSSYKHSYDIKNFSAETFTDIIKEWYEGKDNSNVEEPRHRDGEIGCTPLTQVTQEGLDTSTETMPII